MCSSPYLSGNGKYGNWVALIDNAMGRWETATNAVQTYRLPGDQCGVQDTAIPDAGDPAVWEAMHVLSYHLNSEIRVVEDRNWQLYGAPLSGDLFKACLFEANACVTSPAYGDPLRHAGKAIRSADISVKVSILDHFANEYKAPMSTRFGVCFPQVDENTNRGINYAVYEIVLHEIGHALGLSNAGELLRYRRLHIPLIGAPRILEKSDTTSPIRRSWTR